ncbi:uncharacterized [Tachysurus ichikawai]
MWTGRETDIDGWTEMEGPKDGRTEREGGTDRESGMDGETEKEKDSVSPDRWDHLGNDPNTRPLQTEHMSSSQQEKGEERR